jgi:hypothetical protein
MEDGSEAGYTVDIPRRDAIDAGMEALSAIRVGRGYYYSAQEAGEVYRLTAMEVASFGAGQIDDRGIDYSLWCATTGTRIKRPSSGVKLGLGV